MTNLSNSWTQMNREDFRIALTFTRKDRLNVSELLSLLSLYKKYINPKAHICPTCYEECCRQIKELRSWFDVVEPKITEFLQLETNDEQLTTSVKNTTESLINTNNTNNIIIPIKPI